MIASGPGGTVNLHGDPQKASQRVEAIFRHPQTEHLQYAISKDAALAQRLSGLDDIAFGFELARLAPAGSPAAAPRRASLQPPPSPYEPVNGNSATAPVAFNRCEDFPQIWSIDQGTTETEINVSGFRIDGHLSVTGGRAPDFQAVDRVHEPVAWMALDAGSLRIVDGVAVFGP